MDRGAWRATVHGVTKESDTTEHIQIHTPLCLIQGKYGFLLLATNDPYLAYKFETVPVINCNV